MGARCEVRSARCGGLLVAMFVVLCGVAALAQTPRRIISLIPAVTEMLFAIGAGEQVVGVSSFDDFPPEVKSKPAVGGLFDPNYERILSLRPDLVITYGSQDELVNRLNATKIPHYSYRHGGLAHVTTTIRELGARTGRVNEATRLADSIESGLRSLRAEYTGRPSPRTLIVFEREAGALRGLFVSGGVGFLNDLLVAVGGTNVMADVPREGLQLSTEQLLVRAPDVVIELRGAGDWTQAQAFKEQQVWRNARIPAAKTGRIHVLIDDSLVIPGPRVVAAARAIAAAVHAPAVR